ncbi:MAG: putative membrane protein YfcA [Zhongshania sp.]|jgi:uncharacterized membrane protein YfcA
MDPWVWLGLSIFIAYGVAAITGFGSVVIALAMGALLLPIDSMLPVLVPLNVCMNGYLAIKYRHHIHWPTVIYIILPLMAAGTFLGYFLQPWLGAQTLQLLFGLLVIWSAAKELWRDMRGNKLVKHGVWWTRIWTGLAGITHGLFASGGPLLVYAIAGVQLQKAQFRATLTTVWFSLNSFLAIAYAFDGSLIPSLNRVIIFLPVLIAGVVIGEYLHHRVNEKRFIRFVYSMLLLTGVLLIISKFL